MTPTTPSSVTTRVMETRSNVGISFGAPKSLSNYIGNAGDGKKWLERLTSNLKMFTVPSFHSIAPAPPRLRSLRRGHGNLGLKFHLCLRSEEHLEARALGVVVGIFADILVSNRSVILSGERRFACESAFAVEGPL